MQGPSETPFEGGTFELSINVPEQYPLVPPAMRFKTKIFHPNVHFRVRLLQLTAYGFGPLICTHVWSVSCNSRPPGGQAGRQHHPSCVECARDVLRCLRKAGYKSSAAAQAAAAASGARCCSHAYGNSSSITACQVQHKHTASVTDRRAPLFTCCVLPCICNRPARSAWIS